MTEQQHDTGLYVRMADWARTIHSASAADLANAHRMVEYAVAEIPGADYAGITFVDQSRAVTTAAATHAYPELLDQIQQRHQEGPCLSAAWQQHTIYIADLQTDDRWPRYRHEALQATPVRSVLSFRLFTSQHTVGALNLFSENVDSFTEDSHEIGYVLATHTALAWNAATREGQFRNALASRDVIGQAKGILMARFKIDAVAAFELLRRASQESNTKLVDVAVQLAALGDYDSLRT